MKYDFSLCHIGMMNACGSAGRQGDAQCPLRGACRPGSVEVGQSADYASIKGPLVVKAHVE